MAYKRPLVLYHFPCPDGFGSAYSAWRHFGDRAEYIGMNYGEELKADVRDRDVYILDFSFPRQKLEEIRGLAANLVILDHHRTAMVDLQGFPGAVFNLTKSGSRLAWEYFHPGKELPYFLACIEDRDLWTWQVPQSMEFLAYMDTVPYAFLEWDALANASEDRLNELVAIGRYMDMKLDSLSEAIAKDAKDVVLCGMKGSQVACHTKFLSKVGEKLYSRGAGFAMLWRLADNKLHVSLRSRPNTVDVADIAEKFGGGGHPNAAAFRMAVGSKECAQFFDTYLLGPGEKS